MVKIGEKYEDNNGVRYTIVSIDRENDYVGKEIIGHLIQYGFTHYEFETTLSKFEKLVKDGVVKILSSN